MNDKLIEFINGVGQLCEVWTIIYKSFVSQGMSADEALKHTQAFLTATLNSNLTKQGD